MRIHPCLFQQVLTQFKKNYFPDGQIIIGSEQALVDETTKLAKIGVKIDSRGKAPDVVIHDTKRNWLIIVEAVTSHGSIDQKRRNELKDLFGNSKIGIVYVTAFPDTSTYAKYCRMIAWETDV